MAIVRATRRALQKAAEIIKSGGVVAFPTETVYGLGANAFDALAVKKIFKLKGRPADNPLIVHIKMPEDIVLVAKEIPAIAFKLAKKFWPGPLTLVLKKKRIVPREVSAGLATVAVRVPKHKAALDLIRASGVPIAAPSANISGKPSPTSAKQVADDFGGKVPIILDGGATKVGLESTVVDLTVSPSVILREGGVTFEELKKIAPSIERREAGQKNSAVKSPGMKYRHYAPRADLFLFKQSGGKMRRAIQEFINKHKKSRVGVLGTDESKEIYKGAAKVLSLGSRNNLAECARNLFTRLREFDKLKVDAIAAESFPIKGLGAAIMERLGRASE